MATSIRSRCGLQHVGPQTSTEGSWLDFRTQLSAIQMSKPSGWEPKPLLDESPWSLLPALGMSTRTGWVVQSVLLVAAATVYVILQRTAYEVAAAWFCSAWSLRYVTQRLGGREAQLGTARITPDSPFQARLLMDVAVLAMFTLALLALLFGHDGWRRLLGAP